MGTIALTWSFAGFWAWGWMLLARGTDSMLRAWGCCTPGIVWMSLKRQTESKTTWEFEWKMMQGRGGGARKNKSAWGWGHSVQFECEHGNRGREDGWGHEYEDKGHRNGDKATQGCRRGDGDKENNLNARKAIRMRDGTWGQGQFEWFKCEDRTRGRGVIQTIRMWGWGHGDGDEKSDSNARTRTQGWECKDGGEERIKLRGQTRTRRIIKLTHHYQQSPVRHCYPLFRRWSGER